MNPLSLVRGDLVRAKLPLRDEPVLMVFEREVQNTPANSTYIFKPVLTVELTFQFTPNQVQGFELL